MFAAKICQIASSLQFDFAVSADLGSEDTALLGTVVLDPANPSNGALMCCVHNTARGGETIFISSEELVAALREEQPALLEGLKTTPMPQARSGDWRFNR
jgi:hypothetical protein